jgi:hypothetical protein
MHAELLRKIQAAKFVEEHGRSSMSSRMDVQELKHLNPALI